MSDTLFPTRLLWDGRRGVARHDGVHIELRACPFPAFTEIDFAPGCCSLVRERTDARRDMTRVEIDAALHWLERLAHAARAMAAP